MSRRDVIALAGAALLLAAWELLGWDLAVSGWFADASGFAWRDHPLPRDVLHGGLGIGLVLLAMGIGSVAASASIRDEDLKDAVENVLEWNLALLMTFWLLLQARLWRRLAGA